MFHQIFGNDLGTNGLKAALGPIDRGYHKQSKNNHKISL